MQFLRNHGENLPLEEYLALRKLLGILNTTINRYNDHKMILFNLRRFIEQIKEFDHFSKEAKPVKVSKNKEIQQLYIATSKSFLYGFFTYTPLIKSEIFVKISIAIIGLLALLGIEKLNNSMHQIVASITNAREQANNLGVHC
jgi:hypothetical protein